MLGGVLSALTGHATWQAFALLPDVKPAGLMALAAVTLTCLLVALLAQGARLAAIVTAAPQRSGVAALREKSWRAGFISQRDPDAPGRARPRAPTAGPAAARPRFHHPAPPRPHPFPLPSCARRCPVSAAGPPRHSLLDSPRGGGPSSLSFLSLRCSL